MSAIFQLRLEVGNDIAIEGFKRANAVKVEIVLAHFFQALARDASPAGHILQKRDDLLVSFRATERKNEEGVKSGGCLASAEASTGGRTLCFSHAAQFSNALV